jgi:voltage-gated potassium channel
MGALSPRGGLRRLVGEPVTARTAGRVIAAVSLLVTLLGGVLMWFVDRDDFPTVWRGLWWAVQTVTTVGYGDIVPTTVGGQVIAAVVMLSGIAFVTVVTAAITATFVESARRRIRGGPDEELGGRLEEIRARLDRIEAALSDRSERGAPS